MARKGEVVVRILGDSGGLSSSLDKAGGKFAKFGKVAAVAGAAVVAGVAAGGVALFKVGEQFDAASDKIRVGTGATGKALDGLEKDFKEVVKNVPTDFESASTAIADLNTRLGLTGKPLQDLSADFVNLSRITETDLTTNISEATRAFGDWGIAGEDAGDALDKLFRASQATGASVDSLARQVVQFGAPLRQLGFGFEESIGLLAKFEKEGVNAELVMGSMRIALGKMAREGEPAVETFKRVTEEIKNAGSASEANALALELFGARAGPDMAAAIREGRFELGNLLDTIESGNETIQAASDDTEDFSEKWLKFKNQVLVGLEPLASKVFGAMGSGLDRVIPLLQSMAAWFNDRVMPVIRSFAAFVSEHIIPAVRDAAATIAEQFQPALQKIEEAFKRNEPEIRKMLDVVKEMWVWIANNLIPVLGQVAAFMVAGFANSVSHAIDTVGAMVRVVETLVGWLRTAIDVGRRFADLAEKFSLPGQVLSRIPGLASGGPAQAGQPYVVGEKGPELFIPKASGTVIPNGAATSGGLAMAGGGSVSITVNGVVGDRHAVAEEIRRILERYFKRGGQGF
jgi:TP901 family phage tail tape measure protein